MCSRPRESTGHLPGRKVKRRAPDRPAVASSGMHEGALPGGDQRGRRQWNAPPVAPDRGIRTIRLTLSISGDAQRRPPLAVVERRRHSRLRPIHSRAECSAAVSKNTGCPTATRPRRMTAAYTPALLFLAPTIAFSTSGVARAESGSKFTIEQRSS
jgi:hypothetical protein